MSYNNDERIRLRHQIDIMRRTLEALEIAIAQDVPIGGDVAQYVAATAVTIALTISKADAFYRVEKTTQAL